MTDAKEAVRRYQQRVGGSGTTGDEFQFIETVPATAYDAVVRDNEALRAALKDAEEADMFEDGVAADLHDANITRLADAYITGRTDVLIEIRAALTRSST